MDPQHDLCQIRAIGHVGNRSACPGHVLSLPPLSGGGGIEHDEDNYSSVGLMMIAAKSTLIITSDLPLETECRRCEAKGLECANVLLTTLSPTNDHQLEGVCSNGHTVICCKTCLAASTRHLSWKAAHPRAVTTWDSVRNANRHRSNKAHVSAELLFSQCVTTDDANNDEDSGIDMSFDMSASDLFTNSSNRDTFHSSVAGSMDVTLDDDLPLAEASDDEDGSLELLDRCALEASESYLNSTESFRAYGFAPHSLSPAFYNFLHTNPNLDDAGARYLTAKAFTTDVTKVGKEESTFALRMALFLSGLSPSERETFAYILTQAVKVAAPDGKSIFKTTRCPTNEKDFSVHYLDGPNSVMKNLPMV